jgi:hypothetical protein
VLREYPDADLSAFDVQGDADALALDEGCRAIEALMDRAGAGADELDAALGDVFVLPEHGVRFR